MAPAGQHPDAPEGRPRTAHEARAPGRLAGWWPVLIPVVIVVVGAWLYRWVDEDAFIDFRIIHNLLAGYGPVFNVGERVEADSDPLWLLTLAALHVVLPFASLEWTSVVLGLVCTGAGFLTGGLAAVRLGQSRGEGTVFPLGLLVASVVAGVWEFATSGLEMSMVFLWLGGSFLLLVRVETGRSRPAPAAVVFGLGCLIRPELLLGSAILVAALLMVARPTDGGSRWKQRGGAAVGCAGRPSGIRALPDGLLRPGRPLDRAGQGRGSVVVVTGRHLSLEPARSLHPLVAAGPCRSDRLPPYLGMVASR